MAVIVCGRVDEKSRGRGIWSFGIRLKGRGGRE